MDVHDQLKNLTGLEQLRALIAGGRRPRGGLSGAC